MSRAKVELYSRFTLGMIATAIYFLPLFWMVSTSLKPTDQIFQKPPVLFPTTIQIDSYRSILGLPTNRPEIYVNAGLYLRNSLFIALATTFLTLALAVCSAPQKLDTQYNQLWRSEKGAHR